jgi:ADP-heptose:LPS heptosyltransferase
MPTPSRPLIVRLRNWVGDVTLGLPTLQRLADAGHDLHLLGKGWAQDLLAGHGWPVTTLPKTVGERVRLLRRLRSEALAADPAFDRRLNAVCFPYSFSSALEFRLAGLRAIGHAYEGRSLLLGRSVPRPHGLHELQVYWRLGSALLGHDAPAPSAIGLHTAPEHRDQARALRERHAVAPGYIVICPFAGGTYAGADKTWPGFADFAAHRLPAFGRTVLVCPGPGEEAEAREHFASATLLCGVGLGAYAALLEDAALMISNDTGPGHLAAAVGTPLLSVLGPTEPAQWGAWGPSVHTLKRWPGWPTGDEVAAAAARLLATTLSTPVLR